MRRRAGILRVLLLLLPAFVLCGGATTAAEKKGTEKGEGPARPKPVAAVRVQAVRATGLGKNADRPEVEESLREHAGLLRTLGYGRYQALSDHTARPAAGTTAGVAAGEYTLEISVRRATPGREKPRRAATAMIVVAAKRGDKYIFRNQGCALRRGVPMALQIGSRKAPTVVIISLTAVEAPPANRPKKEE